jgi:hypothetical protein
LLVEKNISGSFGFKLFIDTKIVEVASL